MRHNSTVLYAFVELMKVTNHTGLGDAKLAWYSPNSTLKICLYGLEDGLRIHSFKPTWHCLIVKVLTTWAEFLETFGYCIVIYTFCKTNGFGFFCNIMVEFQFTYSSVWVSNHTESVAMHNGQTTTILLTTVGTSYSLNCFSHTMHMPQTDIYQNIAKLFIHPCINEYCGRIRTITLYAVWLGPNSYSRKWNWWLEFKSWIRLFVFHRMHFIQHWKLAETKVGFTERQSYITSHSSSPVSYSICEACADVLTIYLSSKPDYGGVSLCVNALLKGMNCRADWVP